MRLAYGKRLYEGARNYQRKTINLPNVKHAVSLFTRQCQLAETLLALFLAHLQSEFALYFVRTLH